MVVPNYFTHYSYLSGPDGMRVPEDFFDLGTEIVDRRRVLIGELLDVGRLLAQLPEGFNYKPDRQKLEDFLNKGPGQ